MPARRTDLNSDFGAQLTSDTRKVLTELFHHLSQPLTALNCAMSLLVTKPRQFRPSSGKALLQQLEKITWITNSIRALIDSTEEMPIETCELTDVLADTMEELLPVAAAKSVELRLAGDHRAQIRFNREKLRLAIFCLLDFALGISCEGTKVLVKSQKETVGHSTLIVQLSLPPQQRKRTGDTFVLQGIDDLGRRVTLTLARTIFESARATFRQGRKGDRVVLETHLPNACREAEQPLTHSFRRPA